MDDFLKDHVTGGDGHIDGIKAYLYNTKFNYLIFKWILQNIYNFGA